MTPFSLQRDLRGSVVSYQLASLFALQTPACSINWNRLQKDRLFLACGYSYCLLFFQATQLILGPTLLYVHGAKHRVITLPHAVPKCHGQRKQYYSFQNGDLSTIIISIHSLAIILKVFCHDIGCYLLIWQVCICCCRLLQEWTSCWVCSLWENISAFENLLHTLYVAQNPNMIK